LARPGDERAHRVVLRRPEPEWIGDDAEVTQREAATLAHVRAHTALPVPEVVAVRSTPRPALLMRKLAGRIDLAPRDPVRWLQQQADALTAIHAVPPIRGAPIVVGAPDLSSRRPPSWSRHPHRWEQALATIAAGHPDPARSAAEATFVHGDFQHFNLLWSRGRLTGIVDWSGDPTRRHPARDVGHCRLNLVILYGSEVAEDLARGYAGPPLDPWWDLLETCVFLPSWGGIITRQVGNRLPSFDVDAMHRRVDDHLPVLLRRLGA
jgi:hypothetical protein